MSLLAIRKYPDPVVREATKPVDRFDRELKLLTRGMVETMHEEQGIGLAANQVGVQKSVIVIEIDEKPRVFVNPVIVEKSEETEIGDEGCLSLIPEIHIPIERSLRVSVQALDERGKPVVMEAEGLLARIFQHEVDHLNGYLIIDRASEEVRKQALRDMASLFGNP
ncbi:MAG: peptide deformylase [Candidatus Aquicultorales bacterium]